MKYRIVMFGEGTVEVQSKEGLFASWGYVCQPNTLENAELFLEKRIKEERDFIEKKKLKKQITVMKEVTV